MSLGLFLELHGGTSISPLPGAGSKMASVARLYLGSISASPTACPLRGYGRAGTQNDPLSEAVILSTGTPIPGQ